MTDGNARFVRSLFLSKTRKTRLSVSKSSKYGKMAIENIGGMNMVTPKYQRVVLKLSGEALAGDAGFGIKPPVIKEIIQDGNRCGRRKYLARTNRSTNGHGTRSS